MTPTTAAAVLVTGGASGIGRALAEQAARAGARVAVTDIHAPGAVAVAADLPGGPHLGFGLDVTAEGAVRAAVHRAGAALGPLGTVYSNAGVNRGRDLGHPADWETSLSVHVLAHVHLARHALPVLLANGGGRFVITASAAGLLTNIESAAYGVSKHAAVAFAEWLAIRHGNENLQVACICPQGVRTGMTAGREDAPTGSDRLIEAADVATATAAALAEGRFLVLPHPEVADYERRRVRDRDRWLGGMRRVRDRMLAGATTTSDHPKEHP